MERANTLCNTDSDPPDFSLRKMKLSSSMVEDAAIWGLLFLVEKSNPSEHTLLGGLGGCALGQWPLSDFPLPEAKNNTCILVQLLF